ncbi:MAG: hypothetical protein ACXWV6_10640, partial [Chitinophagaceae bacterium]
PNYSVAICINRLNSISCQGGGIKGIILVGNYMIAIRTVQSTLMHSKPHIAQAILRNAIDYSRKGTFRL